MECMNCGKDLKLVSTSKTNNKIVEQAYECKTCGCCIIIRFDKESDFYKAF